MNSVFDEDRFSLTNVSLLDENVSYASHNHLTTSPTPLHNTKSRSNGTRRHSVEDTSAVKNLDKDARNTTTSLKSQESIIDALKKENFNLKLRTYFLEERLRDTSTESVDKAIKENINMKVAVQSLTAELKKYKAVILELNQGIDILQKKKCTLSHGMSEEEKDGFERLKGELEVYHDENDKLSRMMADLTAENVKLRTTIRTSRSTANQNTHVDNENMAELTRKYRQAKLKMDEQHRMIQILQSKSNNMNTRSNYSNQDDQLVKSILSEKEQLENELQKERMQTDDIILELKKKEREILQLQSELDEYTAALHDSKQQLRNKTVECERLREQNNTSLEDNEDMQQLINTVSDLQQDNDELVAAVESRDQDIATLETEMEKLLMHLEKKEGEDDSLQTNNRIIMLEEALQEREDELEALRQEIKLMTESHDDDIEAFEEMNAKAQTELSKKEKECKHLLTELEDKDQDCKKLLEDMKKDYEEELDKLYNEMVVSTRDREVRIATLEGNFEQKADTMQRERGLLGEEIEELQNKLRERDSLLSDMTKALNEREDSKFSSFLQSNKMQEYNQQWQAKVDSLRQELRDLTEKYRHERAQSKEDAIHQNNAHRALKEKLLQANKKNELMSNMVDEQREGMMGSESSPLVHKLNYELRKEIEQRDRDFDHINNQYHELAQQHEQSLDEISSLRKQLSRRNNMLTNSLVENTALKEKGQMMENVLYDQATGRNHQSSFRERSDSAMSSY